MSASPYATTATNTPQHTSVSIAPDYGGVPPVGLQHSIAPSSYTQPSVQYHQPELPPRPKSVSMDSPTAATSNGAYQQSRTKARRSVPVLLYILLILLLVGVIVVIVVMTAFTASSYHQLSDIRSNTNALTANTSTSCQCPTCPNFDPQLLANALGVRAFAQNADSALTRTLDGPAFNINMPGYDPVFDFNIERTSDSVTPYGYAKAMNVDNFPAVHNQAMAQTLFQLEVGGSNSPHHHPDGVEILFVFQGEIEVTRIEPNGGGKFINTLHANMTVIFPRGHIHFQRNIGTTVARYISTLNSERPGVMSEAQRICELPYDALLSMFSIKTAEDVYQMCANVPKNIIHYVTGSYPGARSSSTGGG